MALQSLRGDTARLVLEDRLAHDSMRERTKRGSRRSICFTRSLPHAHTNMRVCGHCLEYMRGYLVRRDEGVVQPALQHVLELSAITMGFGHLGVAAARDHLHSHSP